MVLRESVNMWPEESVSEFVYGRISLATQLPSF